MYKFISKINKSDLKFLYSSKSINEKFSILTQFGPLQPIFKKFIEIESKTQPIENEQLIELFDICSDISKSAEELTDTLQKLAPGNGQVGFQQVNFLVDRLREKVWNYLKEKRYNIDLAPHDHAFGSGGDFIKTMHATTSASIVVAPLMTICKTGTTNVTSHHGSSQAMKQMGYNQISVNPVHLKELLSQYHFAFVSLTDLGFPYSETLKQARKNLWNRNLIEINQRYNPQENNWQKVLQNLDIPLDIDIFKILAPNAQVLEPVHHSTGVCHIGMIPYVLGIYLHLNSCGIIYHSYDGIDEISNASTDLSSDRPNNLILKVEPESITIAEFSPEDIGLERVSIEKIKEEKNLKNEINTFWKILSGDKQNLQAKRDFIVANAALLLVAGNQIPNVDDNIISQLRIGVKIAENLIASGKSHENFNRLLNKLM